MPYSCYCHYNLEDRVNVYNCSSSTTDVLPSSVPNYTDWVWLEKNRIKHLASEEYLATIKFLNMKQNIVSTISDSFVTKVIQSKNMKWLNLAQNKLTKVPKKMQELKHLERIWLSSNPFHCDCSMTWMIGWLNNFTTQLREHTVVDYQDVKCHSGKMKGFPIFVLDEIRMGCFPSKWTLGQQIGISFAGAVALIIIITLFILVVRKYREIKFFFYHYFKWCKCIGVARGDKNENLDNMEYDAFLYYR